MLAASGTAHATGFTELGQDVPQSPDTTVSLDGYFRTRGEGLYHLDLGRGPTPSGSTIFPTPKDPNSHLLIGGDMRLRTDVTISAPGGMLAVKGRFDVLDNVAFGSGAASAYTPNAPQQDTGAAIRAKRVYGLAITPLGVIAAGRMGQHFGLGMFANGGDCLDCDGSETADRIAFITPLFGHVFAVAYDLSASGPLVERKAGNRSIDAEPSDDVHSVSFAFLKWNDEPVRDRRKRAGRTAVEYGAWISHRWQENDIPASYYPTAQPIPITDAQVVPRGYTATAIDAWFRVAHPYFRVEAEGAFVKAQVDQSSLVPGVLYRKPVKAQQLGAVLESEAGPKDGGLGVGFDTGYASGDSAPGFGAFPVTGAAAPKPGDLDGAQANPPRDNRIDNFRFSPDYRVDRILFREIIGTVTDAVYLRPHVRARLIQARSGTLEASLAMITSWAVYAQSTPGGHRALGTELDPTLAYRSKDGFLAALEYGVLFPGAGFDNQQLHLNAQTAQLWRLRLQYLF